MEHRYDVIIIGGGPGGYVAAVKAAKLGLRSAVVERDYLGGTCLNRGCIPTKTLLHTAELYQEIRTCQALGIRVAAAEVDMEGLQQRKEEVISQLRDGIAILLKKHKVMVYQGTGTILAAGQVRVRDKEGNNTSLQAKNILLATGSVPAGLTVPGADLPEVMTSDELLQYRESPFKRLLIVGGGVIGMEFAALYQALGTQVTVVEYLDRILANMDREFAQNLKMISKKRGTKIITGAQVLGFEKQSGQVSCRYLMGEQLHQVETDAVLVAVGRRAFTDNLFAAGAEPEMERGRILINGHFETSITGIYAIGDVTGGLQLAHAASAQGVNAVCHMAGVKPEMDLSIIPGCVYTSPEIATTGLTQDEAKRRGADVVVGKYLTSTNGKSLLSNQERGFIKVVADKKNGQILGAQMMCARATDMISEFSLAISKGLTLEDMAGIVRPHPTFSEGVTEACEAGWEKQRI